MSNRHLAGLAIENVNCRGIIALGVNLPIPAKGSKAMNADAIREWLNRQPFEPFELRLSNGEFYQVRHPEVVAIGRTRIVVVDPNTDQVVHIALVHINSIQALQAA